MDRTTWHQVCVALCCSVSLGVACSSDGSDSGRTSASGGASGSGDILDGGLPPPDATSDAGVCGGETPHGCYIPQPTNHPQCPPRSPEQSAFYPPTEEWKGCNGIVPEKPFGGDLKASCSYKSATGETATCLCDTGLHWLCVYPPVGDASPP